MILKLDTVGNKGAIDVQGVRRISLQAMPTGGAPSSAVLEVKRAFGAQSPSASFSTAQTVTLDGTAITEIDVTDTAWLHLVCTTAESSVSVDLEYTTSGPMQGQAYIVDLDATATGVRGTLDVAGSSRVFVLAEARGDTNSSAFEIKRAAAPGFNAVSFSSAVNLTIDGSTITEIDTARTGALMAVCGTSQASQRLSLWVYRRDEVPEDSQAQMARYSLSSTTGSFTTTLTTLPLDRADTSASWVSNSSGTLTLDAGTYLVWADVTIDESSGNNRTEFESIAQENSSGSFTAVPGTARRHYSRNNSQGAQSSSMSFMLTLSESASFRIQSRRVTGSNTGEWIADGSSVTIQRV